MCGSVFGNIMLINSLAGMAAHFGLGTCITNQLVKLMFGKDACNELKLTNNHCSLRVLRFDVYAEASCWAI